MLIACFVFFTVVIGIVDIINTKEEKMKNSKKSKTKIQQRSESFRNLSDKLK